MLNTDQTVQLQKNNPCDRFILLVHRMASHEGHPFCHMCAWSYNNNLCDVFNRNLSSV